MLTKKDIQLLKASLQDTFVTREEFNDKLLQFKDDILSEIKNMREDLAVTIGYRGLIEDHEDRITQLEHNQKTPVLQP